MIAELQSTVLTRKLELFGELPPGDKQLLNSVTSRGRVVRSHRDIVVENESPSDVHLIIKGFACRYKVLKGGARQIVSYLVPGDFTDLHTFILSAMDHSVGTLSECTVIDIPRSRILEMTERPALARAFWWVALVDEATSREWLVNIGRRRSEARIGHLFCELHARLKAVGLVEDGTFSLPITQHDLADTVGLSAVHTNRALQSLRAAGLITFQQSQLVILDAEKLQKFSGFNANYLHQGLGKADAGKA